MNTKLNISTADELECVTAFLREASDHIKVDAFDVLEMCRDAIRRLGVEDSYLAFRDAQLDTGVIYFLDDEGRVRRSHSIGGGVE